MVESQIESEISEPPVPTSAGAPNPQGASIVSDSWQQTVQALSLIHI